MRFPHLIKTTAAAVAVLALISCGDRQAEPPVEVTVVERPVPIEVLATDELGSFEGNVSGLALWQHPEKANEGAILAANGDAGLIMVGFNKTAIATLPGTFNHGVAVSYFKEPGFGNALIAAYDDSADALRLLVYSPQSGLSAVYEDTSLAGGTCLVRKLDEEKISLLTIAEQGGLTSSLITKNPDATISLERQFTADLRNASACVGDDTSGIAYVLTDENEVFSVDVFAESSAPQKMDVPLQGTIASLSVMLAENGESQLLAFTKGPDADVQVFNSASGELTGILNIGGIVDIDPVSTISAAAADAANFGEVYRNGTIAVVEGADTGKLKLVPWQAAKRGLALEAPGINRRQLDIDEEDALGITLDLPTFTDNRE